MQKQRIILIIGIVLGIIAVFMAKAYIDQQRQTISEEAKKKLAKMEAEMQTNQTAVLIAKEDIPRGVMIEPAMLDVQVTPNQYLQPQVVTSLDRVAGMVTIAPISKGEQITLSKLAQPKQVGGLAEVTPVGKRAITISVDNIAALAGMIKPGDYVDVIALLSVPVQTLEEKQVTQVAVVPLFQNVQVLAVGQQTGRLLAEESRYKREERAEVSPLITLALTPQEANLIAFVQEQGKIRLVLRSPADAQVQPVQPASWETLFQYVMPKEEVKPVTKEAQEPTEYVEIIRGLSKEKVPLSK
jgi:pilus assembly protein CpaB